MTAPQVTVVSPPTVSVTVAPPPSVTVTLQPQPTVSVTVAPAILLGPDKFFTGPEAPADTSLIWIQTQA